VTALVVALAGTDHHPFDRMVDWMDMAAERRPEVRFVVQHGTTKAPRVAEGHAFLTHAALVQLLADATAVVCHGGPGTIMDAREAGHVPLCVPRDPALGEHVDGHQQRFAALVGGAGVVRHVTDHEGFERELDRALSLSRATAALEMATRTRDAARAKLAAELDGLLLAGSRRRGLLRRAF
jgi:UDP-N-acetylglucosamine transferase subunit ALG13